MPSAARTTTNTDDAARRPYRSTLRAQQAAATRRAVLDAARELFLAEGWAATGVRDVAAAAGVAIETVYAHFSSKRGLLRALADLAVVGDDASIPLAERPEFLAIGRGRRRERLRAAAAVATGVNVRTAAIARLLREAAPTDHEIAEMLRETRERQRADTAGAIELIIGRPPTPTERDGIWAIVSPEVYLLLVESAGWTAEQYESWVAETTEQILPRS